MRKPMVAKTTDIEQQTPVTICRLSVQSTYFIFVKIQLDILGPSPHVQHLKNDVQFPSLLLILSFQAYCIVYKDNS